MYSESRENSYENLEGICKRENQCSNQEKECVQNDGRFSSKPIQEKP